MLKKSLTFGVVAAAMIIAPTAALADTQEQYNNQSTYQSGAAVDGSSNHQNSENYNYQQQTQENRYERGERYYPRYRDRYYDRDRDDRYYDREDYDRDRYYRH